MTVLLGKSANIGHILRYGFISLVFAAVALASVSVQARYASIVVDYETGKVLHSVNADTRNYPASLTKMMTIYLAFEAVKTGKLTMDQRLTVSARAAGARPSKLGLRKGETITVRDAILALITKSANDVAVVVAEALSGTERNFGVLMTKKARELGMKRTNFRNASGLPNRRQLSTARDMSKLARRLLTDFPAQYRMFSTKQFEFKGRKFRNHNSLLVDYPGADGMKTGYTRASGFNLVVSARRNGHRIIGVVFGGKSAKSRNRHMRRLLNRSFAKLTPEKPKTGTVAAQKPKKPISTPATTLAMSVPKPLRKPSAPRLQSTGGKAGWSIQVGAFRNKAPARQAAKQAARQLQRKHRGTRVQILPTKLGDELIYRARLVGLSQNSATEACRQLKSRRVSCVPVPPKPSDANS